MNKVKNLTIHVSQKKQYKWPFSKDKIKRYNELCSKKVSEEELHEQLEAAHIYYLNGYGLSVSNNAIITKSEASIQLVQLNSYTNNYEHIYAWMYKYKDGTFKNIVFGTRYDFDKMIIAKRQDILI